MPWPQVACIMQGDSVPMRIHWPRHADLRINNMVYRPYSRNSATKLGANARDEPASVAVMCPQVPIPAPSSILSTHSPAKKLPSARSMSPFLNAFSGSSVRRLQCSPEDGILLVFGSLVPPHKNTPPLQSLQFLPVLHNNKLIC